MQKILNINNNTIYDDGEYYYIVSNMSNIKYKIDRDYKLVENIQKVCKKYGALYICRSGKRLLAKVSDYAYLSQIVYSFFNKKGVSHIRNGQIMYRDGDNTNCTIDNLYYSKGFNLDTACRKIDYDDEYIYCYHKKTRKTYIMNYSNDLIYILKKPNLTWSVDKGGRLRAFISNARSDTRITAFISSIAYWFYNGYITGSKFIPAVRKLQKEHANKGITIDHLDNDIYNNCKWNLSTMTIAQNTSKPNSRKYFKDIFRLDMVYDGARYILQFKYIANKKIMVIYYTCNTPDELIERIKHLKSHKWEIRHKREGEDLDTEIFYIKKKFPFIDVICTDKNGAEIQKWIIENCQK